jgi:hypothetical protein
MPALEEKGLMLVLYVLKLEACQQPRTVIFCSHPEQKQFSTPSPSHGDSPAALVSPCAGCEFWNENSIRSMIQL